MFFVVDAEISIRWYLLEDGWVAELPPCLNSFYSISRFLKCFDTFDQTPSARRRSWLFTREGCVHHIRSSVIALTFFWLARIALLWPQYIFEKEKNQLREAGISVFLKDMPKGPSRSLKSLLSKEAWPLISSLCAKGPQHYNNLWAPQYQIFFVCSFKTYHLLTLFKKSKVQKIINMKW